VARSVRYVAFGRVYGMSTRRGEGVFLDEVLDLPEERAVLLPLGKYPEAVLEACESAEPSVVARRALDLAQATSQYLSAGSRNRARRVLLDDDAGLRAARLHLVDAVRNTLSRALELLGVKAPEAM